tara:strand:- start:223 stop:390 length:168 start_codon:yes stop_codon:yes gene_type:complete
MSGTASGKSRKKRTAEQKVKENKAKKQNNDNDTGIEGADQWIRTKWNSTNAHSNI